MDELLNDYNNYILKIPNGCLVIADLLRKEQLNNAFESIKDFAEGMNWIVEANKVLAENNLLPIINFNKIQDFLIEINQGLEIQDFVLVADLFEYEIAPFFEEILKNQ